MVRVATCDALSPQLNCGCCDSVMLGCDLPAHPGNPVHAETREEYDENRGLVKVQVIWTIVEDQD